MKGRCSVWIQIIISIKSGRFYPYIGHKARLGIHVYDFLIEFFNEYTFIS